MALPSDDTRTIRPGVFCVPPKADLRSIPEESPDKETQMRKVWQEVSAGWGYAKPDGWRFQLHKVGDVVHLFSRSGKDWAGTYDPVVDFIRNHVVPESTVLDVELVGYNRKGVVQSSYRLQSASSFTCYVLDTLFIGSDLTQLPIEERLVHLKRLLDASLSSNLVSADYRQIKSLEELSSFYHQCKDRAAEGYDGMIFKRKGCKYFSTALKLKQQDTIDAVIVGAFYSKKGEIKSLLVAVLDDQYTQWIPIAKVDIRSIVDWDDVWESCKAMMIAEYPNGLYPPPDKADAWIRPSVVLEIEFRLIREGGKGSYLIHAEAPSKAYHRRDKGPNDVTTYQAARQMGGLDPVPPPRRLL
jgi:ATP-dependent DNA ligase